MADELDQADQKPERLLISAGINTYDLSVVVVMDERVAFSSLRTQQNLMYLILGASMLALVACSVLFSRKLVDPIRAMMGEMEQVEQGNFDIQLPVQSKDEIGVLSDRFNRMSAALKKYIDKFYVAQIRQTEAELTALRSQIYPHFLYNTLE
ncbi:MAG TPA: two-component sensor histidine kinase, partial [Lachnospiraceae bacterium]|nr:two-component sensor histidine kinase [Lachnospiraceae bacterium]